MRSRAVRLTLLVLFVAAVGVTAYLFWIGETRGRVDAEAARSYDQRAIAAARDIVDLRGSQQAYVAAGQGDEFWAAKVADGLTRVREQLARLRSESTAVEAQTSIDAATASLRDFEQMDKRAKDYARGGQFLLASDVIFADGLSLTSAAVAAIDRARAAESGERETVLAGIRDRQLFALGAAAAAALLVVLLLVPRGHDAVEPAVALQGRPGLADSPDTPDDTDLGEALDEGWSSATRARAASPAEPVPATPAVVRPSIDIAALATLCTDLARLGDTRSLPLLLERAAAALDASGIVLWIADPDGRELSPILTHGYPANVVNRIGTILRDDQNATAAAFRTSLVQTVKTDAISNGAIAAPLVTPTGCVGVMAAEVRHGGDQDAATLSAASIVAAQLATLVGPPSARAHSKAEAAG